MSWSGGTELMQGFIRSMEQRSMDHDNRKNFYLVVIPALQDMDWDTAYELEGVDQAYDEALAEIEQG
jgi:hypothetical protein